MERFIHKYIYLILIFVLTLPILYFIWKYNDDSQLSFSIKMVSDSTDTLCAFRYKKNIYLYIPGNADPKTLTLKSRTLTIDGKKYDSGDSISDISFEERHGIKFEGTRYNFYIMQGSKIPSIFVTTATGSLNEVYNDKKHKEPVSVKIYNKDGNMEYSDINAYIKGRGNTTWDWGWTDKKPFSLIFSEETSVLGLAKAERIALLANSADITNVRNKSALDLAKKLEPDWSPSSEFVELYVDGEYLGLYLACDKIESTDEKIVLNTDSDHLLQATARLDDKETSIFTNSGQCFFVRSGDDSATALSDLNMVLNEIEAGIISDNIPEQLDLESFLRKYFLEQIVCNTDVNSLYFYYKNDKLYSGPAWDYDLAANRSCTATVYSLRRFQWYDKIFDNKSVKGYLLSSYLDVYRDVAYDYCSDVMELQESIYESNKMNASRWVSMYHYADIDKEYQKLNDKYLRHIQYLDKAFIENSDGKILRIKFEGEDLDYLYFADENGMIEFPDDSPINSEDVWLNASDGSVFNPNIKLSEDITIYKKN